MKYEVSWSDAHFSKIRFQERMIWSHQILSLALENLLSQRKRGECVWMVIVQMNTRSSKRTRGR